jgi:hypothetical protein
MKTTLLRVYFLALPFLFFPLGSAHAQCKPGDILVGEDADQYFCMEKGKYEGSAAQKFGSQFCQAKQAVEADQSAIRALGFALDAERFEMFASVAAEEKTTLQQRVFDALLDQGLDASEAVLKSAKSLNPWNVNNAVKMLEAKGYGNASVIAALRRVAAQKDKPGMFSAYQDFVRVAKNAKEGWSTGSDMVKSTGSSQELRLVLGALKMVQGNPELGLAITTAELGESVAYLAYLSGQVSELGKLSDEKLERLSGLSKRLKGHVEAMGTSKKGWRNSTGYATGLPVCHK